MKTSVGLSLATVFCVALAAGPLAAARQAPEPPAPELKKLEFLAGKSTIKGKMYLPGQAPTEWTTTEDAQWVLGGRYLRTLSRAEFPGLGTEEVEEVMGYDSKAKVYRLWRFTEMDSMPIVAEGNFQGAKLVMTTKPDSLGQVFRVTLEPKPPSNVYLLLEMKMDGKFERMLEATYTPKK